MGLVTILVILLIEWNKGNLLENDKSVSMLALIYLIFFAMNTLVYFALNNLQNFLTILERLA